MQAREETTSELTLTRPLVHRERYGLFDDFRVVFLTAQLLQCADNFVGIARVKILVEAFSQLHLELTQCEHGAVDGFGRAWIVAPLLSVVVDTAENVLGGIFRHVVEGVFFINRNMLNVRRIHLVLPQPLTVATLFLMHAIVVTGNVVGCFLPGNVTLIGPLFYLGLKVLGDFNLFGDATILFRDFGHFSLCLSGNVTNAFPAGIVYLALRS
jgi:hypothetical protein